jgi:hypothetical protein
MDIAASGNNESEIALQLVAGLNYGNTVDLRVLDGSTVLTYTQTPRINIIGTLTLDTGTVAVGDNDILASPTIAIDTDTVAVAGSDVTNFNGPTWVAALDTNATINADDTTIYLLSGRIENSGGDGSTSFKWRASYDGGAYFDVTTVSTIVQAVPAVNFANDDDVPAHLGAGDASYVTDNNAATEDGTTTLPANFGAGKVIDFVLAFRLVKADVVNAKTLVIRPTLGDNTLLGTYTNTFTGTISKVSTLSLIFPVLRPVMIVLLSS